MFGDPEDVLFVLDARRICIHLLPGVFNLGWFIVPRMKGTVFLVLLAVILSTYAALAARGLVAPPMRTPRRPKQPC